MQTITELLELSNEATPDQICEAVTRLKGHVTTLQNELSTQHSELSTLKNTQSSALATAQSSLAAEPTARIELILANALEKGRITFAQRADWQTKFEKDFANAETALANTAPALNTTSQTRDLGEQKQLLANEQTRRAELVAYLAENQACGLSYDDAWALAKKERAALFEQTIRK